MSKPSLFLFSEVLEEDTNVLRRLRGWKSQVPLEGKETDLLLNDLRRRSHVLLKQMLISSENTKGQFRVLWSSYLSIVSSFSFLLTGGYLPPSNLFIRTGFSVN